MGSSATADCKLDGGLRVSASVEEVLDSSDVLVLYSTDKWRPRIARIVYEGPKHL